MTTKLALTSGGGALSPEDVFSTWTYTGTGAAQNIINGIDLANSGGMVWTKSRGSAVHHSLMDTVRGTAQQSSTSDTTNHTLSDVITTWRSDGYALGSDATLGRVNTNGASYVSWAFRRAPRYFDVVSYTGNGAARTVPHSLGVAPGFFMVKRTDATSASFFAFHRSAGAGNYYSVNAPNAAASSATIWNNTAPTDSVFSLGADSLSNAAGVTYVAYLFAHDTRSDGIIQCGSYTGTGGPGSNLTVDLGWEPQFLIIKDSVSGTTDWAMIDALRETSQMSTAVLYPNTTGAEFLGSGQVRWLANGFQLIAGGSNFNAVSTYHYIAIRRPTRAPRTATQVFSPHTYTGNATARTITSPGFAPDLLIARATNQGTSGHPTVVDRFRGRSSYMTLNATTAESIDSSTNGVTSISVPSGYSLGAGGTFSSLNINTAGQVGYAFKRALGFFDLVAYRGTGVARTVSHALGAVPEMIITKSGSTTTEWAVYHSALGNTQAAVLNTTAAAITSSAYWNNTDPTLTQFTVGTGQTNVNGAFYVAYLFASRPGISKVGSYTGNGTSQTINCGFGSGARFVMVKRTSTNGSATTNLSNGWNIADTARGISGSSEPTNAANVAMSDLSVNWLTADSSGFTVVQDSNNDMNVNGATYIFFAVA